MGQLNKIIIQGDFTVMLQVYQRVNFFNTEYILGQFRSLHVVYKSKQVSNMSNLRTEIINIVRFRTEVQNRMSIYAIWNNFVKRNKQEAFTWKLLHTYSPSLRNGWTPT